MTTRKQFPIALIAVLILSVWFATSHAAAQSGPPQPAIPVNPSALYNSAISGAVVNLAATTAGAIAGVTNQRFYVYYARCERLANTNEIVSLVDGLTTATKAWIPCPASSAFNDGGLV